MEEKYERLRELSELYLAAKRDVEDQLSAAIGKIVEEWSAATGLTVEEIWVPMIDVTTLSDTRKRLTVGRAGVLISGISAGGDKGCAR